MDDRAIGTVPPQPTRGRREAALELSAPETARDIGISLVSPNSLDLPGYDLLTATRADVLARLGRIPEARAAYDDAIVLATNHTARTFLQNRRFRLDP